MPTSKKGRLSGGARKEINERRSQEIVNAFLDVARGKDIKGTKGAEAADSVTFARVTKFVGANHIRVAISSPHGPRELSARIPNLYAGRRGATPITTRNVVVLEVGPEFDSATYTPTSSDHFDIRAILDERQVNRLHTAGILPDWMISDDSDGVTSGKGGDDGFVFAEEDDDEEGKGKAVGGAGTEDDDLDIDAI